MPRVELTHLAPPPSAAADSPPRTSGADAGGHAPAARRSLRPFEPAPAHETELVHALCTPLHYEPRYAYPLLVWLHDQGQDETEMLKMIPHVSLRNYAAVAPRAGDPCVVGGYAWIQSSSAIVRAEQAVFAAIEAAQLQWNIHPQRVYLLGTGAGGTMAFRVAFRHPDRFAGVLSLNGPLPDGLAPFAYLKACRRLPILWTQCAAHEHFNDSTLAAQLKLLYTAGFDLTLRQYPEPDPAWEQILPDTNRWIMEHLADSVDR